MKITVTQRDINLGIKTVTSNTKCPIARALRRAGFRNFGVGMTHLSFGRWTRANSKDEFRLPNKVVQFIEDMCGNKLLKPFTFTLSKNFCKNFKIVKVGK